MKKSFLYSCVAVVALTSTMAYAATETADSVKVAFTQFLTSQTQLENMFDVNQLTVTQNGTDFVITLPAVDSDTVKVPARELKLTAAGEFNGYAQYKVDSVFDVIQATFQNMVPNATFTTQSANMNMIWVPHYNLITNNSQNIQGLAINVPDMFNIKADSMVSDTLVQVTSDNRMNKADSQDATGVVLTANAIQLSMPTISYNDKITGSDITGDALAQSISAAEATYDLSVPTLLLLMPGSTEPVGTASLSSSGFLKDDELHFELHIGNVILGQMLRATLPTVFVPNEVNLSMDITNLDKVALQKAFSDLQTETPDQEAFQATMRDLSSKAVINIRSLEVKNASAGMALEGTIQNRFVDELTANPLVHAKIVITNLDKLSPEPTVNVEQCEQTKQQMANVTDQAIAENAIQNACAPYGGFLDDFRPYLDMAKRVVNVDGSTTDTIDLTYDDDVLTLNGKVVE